MATYFHGSSEIQAAAPSDGIQTLFLINPNCLSSYSDASDHHQPPQQQQPTNTLFFNPNTSTTGLNHANLDHHVPPPPNHHLVGIPFPGAASSVPSTNPESESRSTPLHGTFPGIQYNILSSIHQDSVASIAAASDSGGAHDIVSADQMGFHRPAEVSPGRQGLSLSLSSQQAQASVPYNRQVSNEHEIQALRPHVSGMSSGGGDNMKVSGKSPTSVSAVSNGVSGVQGMVLGSKYLRAAQELLDEVANLGNSFKVDLIKGAKEKTQMNTESTNREGSTGSETTNKHGADLTAAQRQELQIKVAKLVNILDEEHKSDNMWAHPTRALGSSKLFFETH